MNPDGVQYSDWVDLARSGDRAAFGNLVRHHQDAVYTLALRLTQNRETAADVAQEAFVRAWRSLPGFRGDAAFGTWLYRITANTAHTMRTRAARHEAIRIEDVESALADGGMSPERAAESVISAARLEDALRSLPVTQREVVVLKDVYGWTHEEVAARLGITVTSSKVRLHRARRRLRQLLAGEL